MSYVLHYAPNTCALATHILLEALGVPYRAVRVDFARQAQRSPEYLRLNPKGRVPCLETPHGVLTETPALLAHLCEAHPAAGLAPLGDAFAMARFHEFNSYLGSTVHVAHAHRMRGSRWADDPAAWEAMKRKVPQSVGDGFAFVEERLVSPWVLGESMSACDFYLFTLASWLEGDGVDTSRLPRVLAHRERVGALPAVARAVAAEKAGG